LTLNVSPFKRIDSNECSKSLGGDRICTKSPCNFPIKNYTEVFHVFYKGNVQSFRCEVSPDRFISSGEADGLNLILAGMEENVTDRRQLPVGSRKWGGSDPAASATSVRGKD